MEAHGLETDAVHRALDVVSEVGEVAKEVLRATQYGTTRFATSDGWEAEVGDVAFSIICPANTTGVDLEKSVLKALKRYAERIKSTRDAGSG